MNKRLVGDKCPCCSLEENWEHAMLCEGAQDLKEKHINKLKSTIQNVKDAEQMQNEMHWMIANMQNYLNNKIEEVCVATQSKIGMKYLFRGWVTRHWTNAN